MSSPQKVTVERFGPSPTQMASTNSARGLMGRMIEVQSLLLAGAADALRGLDPPPVWDLIGALIKARDAKFRVEIIRVLGGLGEGYRAHATVALAHLWQGGDPAIRQAIVEAVLTMGLASLE